MTCVQEKSTVSWFQTLYDKQLNTHAVMLLDAIA